MTIHEAVRWSVLPAGLLTTDDLDEIGRPTFYADQPLRVAAELVDAVERGLLADQADTGYALILAAEIAERGGDLQAAEVLAGRAVEAYRVHQDSDYGYPRAVRAGLLMRLGRDDEAMAELAVLRPLLFRDVDAVAYISQVLEDSGRATTAEQWLTAALATILQQYETLGSLAAKPTYGQAAELVFTLARHRHRLRRDLDLPQDEQDQLAELLMDAMHHVVHDLDEDELDYAGTAVLFWPRMEFDRLLERWPKLVEIYGENWDEHRTTLQHTLVLCSESGHTNLALLPGSVDELAHYADRAGRDLTDPQVSEGYTQQLGEHSRETPWPPGRNQECWCGSGLKYKKCCLPRARS